jgi:hypothetical protein
MRRPLTDDERFELEQAGRRMARDACRAARVPLRIDDPEILAKAAVLLARTDSDAHRRPTNGAPATEPCSTANREVRRAR